MDRPFNVWKWFLETGKIMKPELVYMGLPVKNCYQNSEALAKYSKMKYVEGYFHQIIPLQHAWNIDKSGKVIDCTLSTVQKNRPESDFSKGVYFGVVLPKKLIRWAMKHKKYSISGGSVLSTIAMMDDSDIIKAKQMLKAK